jgi:hypothetical protein
MMKTDNSESQLPGSLVTCAGALDAEDDATLVELDAVLGAVVLGVGVTTTVTVVSGLADEFEQALSTLSSAAAAAMATNRAVRPVMQ